MLALVQCVLPVLLYCLRGMVASVLTIYERPTLTPHDIAETHQNAQSTEKGDAETEEKKERGREGDREHNGRIRLSHSWLGFCGSFLCIITNLGINKNHSSQRTRYCFKLYQYFEVLI